MKVHCNQQYQYWGGKMHLKSALKLWNNRKKFEINLAWWLLTGVLLTINPDYDKLSTHKQFCLPSILQVDLQLLLSKTELMFTSSYEKLRCIVTNIAHFLIMFWYERG